MVLQAICDGLLVPLDCVVVDVNYLLELLESHISHVVLSVHQESTEDVDA